MCGRFTLHAPPEQVRDQFGLDALPGYKPCYNIAPGHKALVIRMAKAGRTTDQLRWGLIPCWAKDPSVGNRMINARVETVGDRPAFRNALKSRRCIIPASGFYEWRQIGKDRQPYYVRSKDNSIIGMAGLWERWERAGERIDSFTIITTRADMFLEQIHHRMPVILGEKDYSAWLGSTAEPADVLQAATDTDRLELEKYPVGKAVNSPAMDTPDLIKVDARLLAGLRELDHYVYVIELDKAVLGRRKFIEANPDHDPEKPCLYVGMTGRTPDERFRQHKEGYKASKYVREYGKHLRRRLYEKYNPMTHEDAARKEIELANELRRKGYAVWQH